MHCYQLTNVQTRRQQWSHLKSTNSILAFRKNCFVRCSLIWWAHVYGAGWHWQDGLICVCAYMPKLAFTGSLLSLHLFLSGIGSCLGNNLLCNPEGRWFGAATHTHTHTLTLPSLSFSIVFSFLFTLTFQD